MVDKNEFKDIIEIEEEIENKKEKINYKKLLSDVEDVLKDGGKMKVIIDKYKKGDTEEEYDQNRGKRIELMLEMAGGIEYEDYILAIKKNKETQKFSTFEAVNSEYSDIRIHSNICYRIYSYS